MHRTIILITVCVLVLAVTVQACAPFFWGNLATCGVNCPGFSGFRMRLKREGEWDLWYRDRGAAWYRVRFFVFCADVARGMLARNIVERQADILL